MMLRDTRLLHSRRDTGAARASGQSATRPKEPLKAATRRRAHAHRVLAPWCNPRRRPKRSGATRAKWHSARGSRRSSATRRPSLSQLRGAAGLDPSDPNLAYELARAYESAGDLSNAARRILPVPVARSERHRGGRRAGARRDPRAAQARHGRHVEGTAFKRGVDASDKGQWADAEVFFTTVLRIDSTSADTYYNRALVRSMQDHRDAAADDYERYLRIRPEALDRAQVVARVNALRAQQHVGVTGVRARRGRCRAAASSTRRRPIRGILSLAAVGAAAAFAMIEKTTTTTKTQDGKRSIRQQVQLFGHDGAQESPVSRAGTRRRRRHRALSAIDAARTRAALRASSVSVSLVPSGNGVEVVASVSIP